MKSITNLIKVYIQVSNKNRTGFVKKLLICVKTQITRFLSKTLLYSFNDFVSKITREFFVIFNQTHLVTNIFSALFFIGKIEGNYFEIQREIFIDQVKPRFSTKIFRVRHIFDAITGVKMKVSNATSFNTTLLLISSTRNTTSLSHRSCITINKRYLPGSSGAGKTPKIPSSSETSVPNTPYKKEDLQMGAETALTNPIQNPYIPPQIPSQSSAQLPPNTTEENSKKSVFVEINKANLEVEKALETAQMHKNHPFLSQPKIFASNNPTPPEFSTPNTTSVSTSTTTTNNTPVPTSATIPIASTQLGSNNNSNPPLSTSFNTPSVTTPVITATPTTSISTTSTISTIHTSNTNPVSSVNPSNVNLQENPMTKINWIGGITHPYKPSSPPLAPSPSQVSNTIDLSSGQKFPSPNSSYPLTITDGRELHQHQTPVVPPSQESSTSFASDNSDAVEHLMATTAGLVPISASFANNPYAVDAGFNFIDKDLLAKRNDPQTIKLMQELFNRGLIELHGDEGREGFRPKSNFRTIWSKLFSNNLNVENILFTSFDLEAYINNFSIKICILTVTENYELETAFLLPEQTHIGLYSIIGNQKIYWSYFTSDQNPNNVFISSYQPLGDDPNKHKRPQMLRVLLPRSILDKDLIPTPNMTITEANTYLSKPEILQRLKNIFIDYVAPHLQTKDVLFIYEGCGVTSIQLENVITEFEREQKAFAEKIFNKKYINKLKLELQNPERTDLQKWMSNTELSTPRAYLYIVELANEYNEKNNIPKRYEISK